MKTEQPEALRLADELKSVHGHRLALDAAAELRRLYEENQKLLEALTPALENICAAKLCEFNSMSSRHEMIRLMDADITAIREAMAEQPAQQQEPVSPKSLAQKAGINLPETETYIPTMDDAIAAGDFVLMNEQAALLRECRAALDSLIAQKPTLAGLLCGSTTLGNLKAELGAYRPQGVFGTSPQPSKPWVGLTGQEKKEIERLSVYVEGAIRHTEAKLREKNT